MKPTTTRPGENWHHRATAEAIAHEWTRGPVDPIDAIYAALVAAEQRGRDEAAGKWEELLQAARHVIDASSMVWPNKTREEAESEAMRRLITAVNQFPHPCAAATGKTP